MREPRRIRIAAAVALGPMAQLAAAQTHTDTFTGGANAGGWTFGAPVQTIPPTGGNPGEYLRADGLDTTIPRMRSTGSSVFTGDLRAARAVHIGVDVVVHSTDFPIGAFPLTLMLVSDNNTPSDPLDDYAAIRLSQAIPQPGAGWKAFLFDVPAASTSLPTNWAWVQFGPGSPANPDWNALITDVNQVAFSFGDPRNFYIFQMWSVGTDNVLVHRAPACYANCDGSTSAPILNVNDFICFQNLYSVRDLQANCDRSTLPPVLNVMDFVCFQTMYAQGCP